MLPGFKLAWVIPICEAPVFGALLYLFIVGDWSNLELKKHLNKRRKETEGFLHTDEQTKKKMEATDVHMANLSRFYPRHRIAGTTEKLW